MRAHACDHAVLRWPWSAGSIPRLEWLASGSGLDCIGLQARLLRVRAPGSGLNCNGLQASDSIMIGFRLQVPGSIRLVAEGPNVRSRNTLSMRTSTLCVIGVARSVYA